MITRFALLALGINKTDYLLQLFGPGVTVWNILWCICGACFIVLSMLWIYGLRTKMTDAERAYNLKGDDHFRNGEKTLRYGRSKVNRRSRGSQRYPPPGEWPAGCL